MLDQVNLALLQGKDINEEEVVNNIVKELGVFGRAFGGEFFCLF